MVQCMCSIVVDINDVDKRCTYKILLKMSIQCWFLNLSPWAILVLEFLSDRFYSLWSVDLSFFSSV